MSKDKKTNDKPKKANKKTKEQIRRFFYIAMFSGSVANAIFLAMLVSDPELGMYILAGFSTASAIYFLHNAIK